MASAYVPPSTYRKPQYATGYLPSFMEQQADYQNQAAGQQAPFDPNGGQAGVMNRIIQDTEGRGDATMKDPRVNAALGFMGGVMDGSMEPYTQQVQNQMMSRSADSTAAGEASQADQMRQDLASRGGNPSDPSAQAAMRQLDQERQGSNNATLGNIQTQATLGNFDARSSAAQQLLSGRMSQLNSANGQYNLGASYHAQTGNDGPHVNGVQTPNFTFNMPGLGQGPSFAPLTMPNTSGATDSNSYAPTTGSTNNPVYGSSDPYGGQPAPQAPIPGSGASPIWNPGTTFGGAPGYQAPGTGSATGQTSAGGNNYYTPPGAAAPQTNAVRKSAKPAYQQFTYKPKTGSV